MTQAMPPSGGVALEGIARDVLERQFGSEPSALRRARGGNAATVLRAQVEGREVILKFYPERERVRWLRTVAELLEEVRAAGVVAPSFHYVGVVGGEYACVVYDRVPGERADHCADERQGPLWREVGRQVARANRIPVPGYGRQRFGTSGSPTVFRNWRAFIEPEVERLTAPRLSADFPSFTDELRQRVRDRLLSLRGWEFSPRLIHGNITASNIIAEPRTGELRGIIDWDGAIFARAPHFELATALLWMEEEARHAILEGYGLSPERYRAIEPDVETARLFYLTGYLLWHLLSDNEPLASATRQAMQEILE